MQKAKGGAEVAKLSGTGITGGWGGISGGAS